MVTLRRAQIVNLVEQSYFSNIDFRRPGTVLDCFAHDGELVVDCESHCGRDGGIKRFFERLLAAYPLIRHEVLTCEVDEAGQRLTCRFTLRLEDAEGRAREARGSADFRLVNGKLATVTVESDDGSPMI